MKATFQKFLKDEDGATAIEYGLIAGLVSIVAIVAMGIAGTQLAGVWAKIQAALTAANS